MYTESDWEMRPRETCSTRTIRAPAQVSKSARPSRRITGTSAWLLPMGCLALSLSTTVALGQRAPEPSAMRFHPPCGPACLMPPPQAAGYCLKLSTDFDPLNLSPNSLGSYTWFNPGMWWESPAPYKNIFVLNSALNLVWTNGQSTWDTSISTAAQDGSHFQGWHYGYFEFRMRWDTVIGAWPAIWMIPIQSITNPGVEQGELDIFEGQGNTPNTYYGTIHDWKNGQDIANNNCCNAYQLPSTVDLSQYHTYGVLWVPGRITWYLDNQPLSSFETFPIFDDQSQQYYLILGSQEGVDWTYGNLAGVTATSIAMQVEWVHVWEPKQIRWAGGVGQDKSE